MIDEERPAEQSAAAADDLAAGAEHAASYHASEKAEVTTAGAEFAAGPNADPTAPAVPEPEPVTPEEEGA